MDYHIIFSNFVNPPVLFFFLGIFAVFVKSNLEVPQPLPKLFSMYLLFSIGFKGGVELSHSGFNEEVFRSLAGAMLLSAGIPLMAFFILRRKLDTPNAAAIAATYGSISAVTFIAALSFLDNMGVSHGGHMVAAMALMESPAIIVAVILARRFGNGQSNHGSLRETLREAIFDGSVLLILGSLVIGLTTNPEGVKAVKPFTDDIFRGMLCLFLLDMGIVAARRLNDIRKSGIFLISFAVLMPVLNAAIGMTLAFALGLEAGNGFILTVLAASASYIAVPAAMRAAIPEANPGLYVPMALALTFPFNIILGIPLYYEVIAFLWP
jgi:hypothetical protein